MKILYCDTQYYYNTPGTISMTYEYFAITLRELGHTVHFFDYLAEATTNREAMNDFFLSIIKNGGYDLVWVTMCDNQLIPEILDQAKKYSTLIAWNSDDDVRWECYSSIWCPHYTYMVTTYRHIYELNKEKYPNLLLSQWGCTGRYNGLSIRKDIDFSFVGKFYGNRLEELAFLQKHQKMTIYGKKDIHISKKEMIHQLLMTMIGNKKTNQLSEILANEAGVKGIWNRSKISFTPLKSWSSDSLQVKARVFDMGLSGTVMLCESNPLIYEFYEPGREFVEYNNLNECVSKVRFLLSHETERHRIAMAYHKRTNSDHLWKDRIRNLFLQMGLPSKKNND